MKTKTPKQRKVDALRRLAREVTKYGIHEVEIEDGELAYLLNEAADTIKKYAPDDLGKTQGEFK